MDINTKKFFESVEKGDLAKVKEWIEKKKISINTLSIIKENALLIAANKGHEDVVRYLLNKGIKTDARTDGGNTFLIHAVIGGNLNIVKLALEKGANINEENIDHLSALFGAVSGGHEDIVLYLLEHGAKPFDNPKAIWSLMGVAADKENETIIYALARYGANIEAVDRAGRTPLGYAAERGKINCMRHLLDLGADIDSINHNSKEFLGEEPHNETALHGAVRNSELESVTFLVNNGASLDIPNGDGYTPLELARQLKWEEGIAYLEKAEKEPKKQRKCAQQKIDDFMQKTDSNTIVETIKADLHLLQKIALYGRLKELFERLPYEQQKPVYRKAEKFMKPEEQAEIRDYMLRTRQTAERK